MKISEMFSVGTVNIVLALFSMVMAIVALGLLAFVIAKERYVPKEEAKAQALREKIKRHESVVVDFRDPATVPDHFLQLNTLMFDKSKKRKANNNQIMEVDRNRIIGLPGLENMMASIQEDDEMSQRTRSSALSSVDTMNRNNVGDSEDSGSREAIYVNSDFSSSGSEAEYADVPVRDMPRFPLDEKEKSTRFDQVQEQPVYDQPEGIVKFRQTPQQQPARNAQSAPALRVKRHVQETTTTQHNEEEDTTTQEGSSEWIVEKSTIEPLFEKITVDLECGSEFSTC